jgi:hypothetical protein
MAQHGYRKPDRLSYDDPFLLLFPAASPITALASHRAASAGNRLAGAGPAPFRDTPPSPGDPARSADSKPARGGDPFPADAAAPARDDDGESVIRHDRRFR